MKKKDINLLVLCILYSIINIIYIFSSTNTGKVFGLIQFIAIYIPFFILLFIKDKKYAIYISLAFCGFELIVSFFEYIKYIIAFINYFSDMFEISVILGLFGKIISNIIKIYLIINIISLLKEENKKHLKMQLILLIVLFLIVISYSIISNFVIKEIITSFKDFILNVLLVVFIMFNCSINEAKVISKEN